MTLQHDRGQALRNCTLVFLVKKSGDTLTEVCLAEKKRGFGAGKWNGVGGKVESGETIDDAAIREAKEEIGTVLKKITKVGELTFHFQNNPSWDQLVHTYLCEEWDGEPQESEEMAPRWYAVEEIPFEKMWPDDKFWLPEVLAHNLVRAEFTFGDNDAILEQNIEKVSAL